ncbi:FecR family protein [Pedobacter psychroterrae]|uniref:DUF4974 domain-containing protein n=1 Tax=Pedobacter psychroterrae TaxID=2530453 RepID=A0A4R0NLS5_9SPHI|nr:FecR domain-containing protein [Pedobacter psychroterrae]TCD00503.1 DUF4974 domain-containing protein [Pedobacter psychroterrae]
MNREELIVLADRILKKEASEAEISAYNAWYNSFQESGEIPVTDEADKKKILYARIASSIDDEVSVKRLSAGRSKIGIWAAAAAVAFLAIGIYFFNAPLNSDKSKTADLAASTGSIKPGRNTAKLTLANGKSIDLSESKTGVVIDVAGLKYNDETVIAATQANDIKKDGLMSIATPRGGTYQVILSDGSKVWLNAASSIQFPASFTGQEQRRITLVGEAYFEIAKHKSQKFVVNTRNQEVAVLGTHFNINSYLEEGNEKTTLLEGSVRVSSVRADVKDVRLVPGQQATVSAASKIEVAEVDVNDVIAWKEGKFVFVEENVPSIMNKIARWYDVEIAYEGDVRRKALAGSVSRFKNVSEVLEMLSATKAVQFRIEGRKVIVMPFKDK